MIDMNALRAFEARGKAAWFAGKGPHPHGMSGHRWMIPAEESCNMWDTHPHGQQFSEWGNAAAAVDHEEWCGLPVNAVSFVLMMAPEEDRGPEWHRLYDLMGRSALERLAPEQNARIIRARKARK